MTSPRLNGLQHTWQSSSFRLALGFGIMVLAILAGIFSVYYVEIVGRVSQQLDDYAMRTSKRLLSTYAQQGPLGLKNEIDTLLADGIDSQTEVLILQSADGQVWAGNAVATLAGLQPGPHLQDVALEQETRSFMGRVQLHLLDDGRYLLAGSDLQPLTDIRDRYFKATGTALVLVIVLSLAAALGFRRLMDQRAAALRRAMHQAGKGNLHFRLPPNAHQDEFSRLEQDINTMLEQLEQLVHGIRHVSNMVAHNLRTPLNRTLRHIQAATDGPPALRQAQLELAQAELQQLSRLFTKMLLLAEVESGIGQQRFERMAIRTVLQDVLEYYEPIFVERGVQLHTHWDCEGWVMAESHLLANALSNLLDNFLKYGGNTEGLLQLDVRLYQQQGQVILLLRDHGHGVPEEVLPRLGSHFFRASSHQHLPGHGIGLASVRAIMQLHQGSIVWRNASPGLETRITLPAAS